MEGVVLLSARATAPDSARSSESAQGQSLDLNGTLHGNRTLFQLDSRAPLAADSQVIAGPVAFFETCGRLTSLGKVSGSFGPNKATDFAPGELPNLNSLTLDLANRTGSVQLTLSTSTTNRYQFKVSGGTGSYSDAYGSGVLTISARAGSNDYLLTLKSGKR
jgi:hypothetical protein